jgi:hypothetical protein
MRHPFSKKNRHYPRNPGQACGRGASDNRRRDRGDSQVVGHDKQPAAITRNSRHRARHTVAAWHRPFAGGPHLAAANPDGTVCILRLAKPGEVLKVEEVGAK